MSQTPNKYLARIDSFQQRHHFWGFAFAVNKKYGEDEGGNEAALITYYGFWSMFPLLIALTSALRLILPNNPHLQQTILNGLFHYFPVFGEQLIHDLQSHNTAGTALVISILLSLYGGTGVARALQHAANNIWEIPIQKRQGFPKSTLKSLGIIMIGGFGFVLATVLSALATSLGHEFAFRALATLISTVILFFVSLFVFRLAVSTRHKLKHFVLSALLTAIGLQIFQILGSLVITHTFKHFNSLYGALSLVLIILYWLYLQAQVVLYAFEVDTVKTLKLWPRSLIREQPTPADHKAYELYARKARRLSEQMESLQVEFKNPDV